MCAAIQLYLHVGAFTFALRRHVHRVGWSQLVLRASSIANAPSAESVPDYHGQLYLRSLADVGPDVRLLHSEKLKYRWYVLVVLQVAITFWD